MDRVSAAGYQTIGGKRFWQNRNLGAGIQGTTFDQVFFSGVQESIVGPIEAVGLTPTDAAVGSPDLQLLNAIQILAAGHSGAPITANTTLTPANAGLVLVNAAGGNVALTLPAAAAANGTPLRFTIVRTDSSANTVTAPLHSGDSLLLGSGTITIPGPGFVSLHSDGGTNWVMLSSGTSGSSASTYVFTTSGTLVVPAGKTSGKVWACAGGAGGNGNYSGGAGQSVQGQTVTLIPGDTLTVTLGAGGAGGSGSTGGTAGGNTTLVSASSGTLLSLTGATAPTGTQSVGFPSGVNYIFNSGAQPGATCGGFGGGGAGGGTSTSAGGNAGGFGAGGGQAQASTGGNGAPGYLRLEL